MIKILVIEDDFNLIKLMRAQFKHEINAQFTYANSYSQGMSLVASNSYDLYLIDIKLDEYSGFDILKILQNEKSITNRVIVMSASKNKDNEIMAYELGASNFILKPLDFDILRSIIKKNIKAISSTQSYILNFKDIYIDSTNRSCLIKEVNQTTQIHLSFIEFNILLELIKNRNVIVSKEDLSFLGKDQNLPMSFKALEMHISSLRKKIGKDYIKTVRNVGYIMEE